MSKRGAWWFVFEDKARQLGWDVVATGPAWVDAGGEPWTPIQSWIIELPPKDKL